MKKYLKINHYLPPSEPLRLLDLTVEYCSVKHFITFTGRKTPSSMLIGGGLCELKINGIKLNIMSFSHPQISYHSDDRTLDLYIGGMDRNDDSFSESEYIGWTDETALLKIFKPKSLNLKTKVI